MKRFALSVISVLALSASLSTAAFAARPASGDANPSDRANTTVDTTQVIVPTKAQVKTNPPSGDLNPSDRTNTTVNTSEIINPTKQVQSVKANPPSGDLNPSDRTNNTVDTSQVVTPVPGTR